MCSRTGAARLRFQVLEGDRHERTGGIYVALRRNTPCFAHVRSLIDAGGLVLVSVVKQDVTARVCGMITMLCSFAANGSITMTTDDEYSHIM